MRGGVSYTNTNRKNNTTSARFEARIEGKMSESERKTEALERMFRVIRPDPERERARFNEILRQLDSMPADEREKLEAGFRAEDKRLKRGGV